MIGGRASFRPIYLFLVLITSTKNSSRQLATPLVLVGLIVSYYYYYYYYYYYAFHYRDRG